jgi:hypothetical protein
VLGEPGAHVKIHQLRTNSLDVSKLRQQLMVECDVIFRVTLVTAPPVRTQATEIVRHRRNSIRSRYYTAERSGFANEALVLPSACPCESYRTIGHADRSALRNISDTLAIFENYGSGRKSLAPTGGARASKELKL